jgi:hypothetical protein
MLDLADYICCSLLGQVSFTCLLNLHWSSFLHSFARPSLVKSLICLLDLHWSSLVLLQCCLQWHLLHECKGYQTLLVVYWLLDLSCQPLNTTSTCLMEWMASGIGRDTDYTRLSCCPPNTIWFRQHRLLMHIHSCDFGRLKWLRQLHSWNFDTSLFDL